MSLSSNKTNIMKRFVFNLTVCSICCLLAYGSQTVQGQNTVAEKSAVTKTNRNFSKKSVNPANNLSRGGHLNYPQGLNRNKSFNMGYQLGPSLALNDALREERCALGANFDFYMHFVLQRTDLLALGTEIKAFYFLTNNSNFNKYTCPVHEEGLEEPVVSTGNWIAGTVQMSLLTNFNATARCNIQLKANAGPLVVMVPKNDVKYQISEIQLDNSAGVTVKEIHYKSGMSIGGAATLGTDLLYALSRHTEIKGGVDWTYMRFAYERNVETKQGQDPTIRISKELRQFGVFNLHIGFAHSF